MDICLLMNQTLNNILGHLRFSIQIINCFKLSNPKCDFLKTLKNMCGLKVKYYKILLGLIEYLF